MISFYSHLDIWLTKDYHWVMAAGIMCLYSQDNIQTLSTHSPTFVWEGDRKKKLEAFWQWTIAQLIILKLKLEHKEKQTKANFCVLGNLRSFVRAIVPSPPFPPKHESVIFWKAKNGSQIDSEFKPETFFFGNITFKSKRQLVKDIMIFHCHQNHGRKLSRNLVKHEGQQIELDKQF